MLDEVAAASGDGSPFNLLKTDLQNLPDPIKKDVLVTAKQALWILSKETNPLRDKLLDWTRQYEKVQRDLYTSHLYSESDNSALRVSSVSPVYEDNSPMVNGFEILNHCFDAALSREPLLVAFGEDLGKIGDVNQGFSGLQAKYGVERVFDTGIREATIIGQGIGMAMRGLRPIAEIQYLDYLLYGLQPLSDDLATLHWRTRGGQKAPLIIRTRGHRLEGVWHSGSPLGMILNSLRGIYVLVPRNMVQAARFYNTMLKSDDPALIIEPLNAYRLKEKLPVNIAEMTLPLGVPEIVHEGSDVTLVTYGSCCRIAYDALKKLKEAGISVELIDVQSLLPFDIHHTIVESLKKTSRIVFLDEDVPGGASAYMMQQVLEVQDGYRYLDSKPITITATANRPAYSTDGDYFCKPNAEDIFEAVYGLMHEAFPADYPGLI
jgi:pyruvate/2-oxoglutarate/acetoin dehydrogenase E1 component